MSLVTGQEPLSLESGMERGEGPETGINRGVESRTTGHPGGTTLSNPSGSTWLQLSQKVSVTSHKRVVTTDVLVSGNDERTCEVLTGRP